MQASEPTQEDEDGGIIVDMAVGGMTCASCVRRVERKLGKLDGVQAASRTWQLRVLELPSSTITAMLSLKRS